MENYKVEQFCDDIVVWDNQQCEFLKVKRKFDWKGKLTSSFIKDGTCIFETTYDIFLFQKFMSITHQNLAYVLSLSKERNIFYLNYNSNRLKSERHYLKNPLYTLHNNDLKIGEVHTSLSGLTPTPINYDVKFESHDEVNMYSLLRFLMELLPTMDV